MCITATPAARIASDARLGTTVAMKTPARPALTVEETAHVLGRSPRTVKREWRLARAWRFREFWA